MKTATKRVSAGVCADVLRLKPANLDEAVIRRLAGDRVVKNLSLVAAEFGIEPTTVRTSWRVAGMPGAAGKWNLADILVWRLHHEAKVDSRRQTREDCTDRELARRQLEAETRKTELQAEKLERDADIAVGKLIDREAATIAIKTAGAVLAERLMKVPAQIEPTLPSNIAADTVERIERLIRRELVAFAETSRRTILQTEATNE